MAIQYSLYKRIITSTLKKMGLGDKEIKCVNHFIEFQQYQAENNKELKVC